MKKFIVYWQVTETMEIFYDYYWSNAIQNCLRGFLDKNEGVEVLSIAFVE